MGKLKMNFNVYVEDWIGQQLEQSVQATGKSRNAIIREAIQLWLDQQKKSQWPSEILDFMGVEDAIVFESYRDELTPPNEQELF